MAVAFPRILIDVEDAIDVVIDPHAAAIERMMQADHFASTLNSATVPLRIRCEHATCSGGEAQAVIE